MLSLRGAAVAVMLGLLVPSAGLAEPAASSADAPVVPGSAKVLVVGTKEAPPFAMKGSDGTWSGAGIELWRRVARKLNLHYRLKEASLQDLIDRTADGSFDAAVAAITVTSAREEVVDFSQPFYATGLGIAVPMRDGIAWLPVLRSLLTFGFAEAILALAGAAMLVGVVVWLVERRQNEHFSHSRRGFGYSVMWSAATMAQTSSGDREPKTLLGRGVAVLWLLASVVVIASFTAGITSQMTTRQLQGMVRGEDDLRSVRVGAVGGTAAIGTLGRDRVNPTAYPTVEDGLRALKSGKIDAFVYDRPLLAWIVKRNFRNSLEVLDTAFDPQDYAIALPPDSRIRVPINLVMLDELSSDWWKETLARYIGKN